MRILEQIVSGGQSGADRAALDVAIKFNIPHGGWITKGRRTETGPLPDKYRLKEMDTSDYPSRTRQNILDSNGTVIISRGPLTGGSKLTRTFAKVVGKPNCHINLLNHDILEAALVLQSFILENSIRILNVAGPRASHDLTIYHDVKSILEAVFYLDFLEDDNECSGAKMLTSKKTVEYAFNNLEQIIEGLLDDLSLRGKTIIARIDHKRLWIIYFSLLDHIKLRTGLDKKDSHVLNLLAKGKSIKDYTPEDAAMDLVKQLRSKLSNEYKLRILQ